MKTRRASCEARNETDEVQYALPKNQANFKMFDTEDEAKEYVANNNIPTVVEFSEKFQKFYITKENILTDAILDGIDKSIEYLNIKVYLGMEYQVGRTWADCH